jgi:hypothetical protein
LWGGGPLLNRYDYSLSKALEEIYPEENMYPWLFDLAGFKFWDRLDNQKRLVWE